MNYFQYQDEMKQLYLEGHSLTEIGKRYGTSKATVKNVLKGVVTFRPQSYYDQFADTWYDMYVNQGYTKKDIASAYHTYPSTVSNVLRKKGVLPEKRVKARKYEDLLPFFIKEYKEGSSLQQIADKHNVDIKIVHQYLHNEGFQLRTITEATRKNPINETYFDVLETNEKAFHLGVVFGKGTLQKNAHSSFLDISIHEDKKELIESLTKALQPDNQASKIKNNVLHRFMSNTLYDSILKYGLKDNCIREIPKGRVASFCKGYLSVRLYVNKRGEWRIKDKKEILNTLKEWFSSIIPASSISLREDKGYYSLNIYSKTRIQQLSDWLLND